MAYSFPKLHRRPNGDRLALTALLVASAAFTPLLVLAGASWQYSLPQPGTGAPAIRVYAGTEPIGTIYPAHRAQSWVPLAEFPRSVVDAVLIAEDRRFWSHAGVDALAATRALQVNLKRGELRQGASTITQQTVKSLLLTPERHFDRKGAEPWVADILTRWESMLTRLGRVALLHHLHEPLPVSIPIR